MVAAFDRLRRWLGAFPAIGQSAREGLVPTVALTTPNPTGNEVRFQSLRARLAGMPEQQMERVMRMLLARAIVSAKAGNPALLRSLPVLAPTRELAAWACQKCATHDRPFQALIADADHARDRGRWQHAIATYSAALRLYVHHAGFHVQLGHCAKEAGDGVFAEIAYRDAIALCAPVGDVWDHLEVVVARNGGRRQIYPPHVMRMLCASESQKLRSSLATSRELGLLAWLLLDDDSPAPGWVLRMLRMAPERQELSAKLIADPAFLAGNRALVALAGRQGRW